MFPHDRSNFNVNRNENGDSRQRRACGMGAALLRLQPRLARVSCDDTLRRVTYQCSPGVHLLLVCVLTVEFCYLPPARPLPESSTLFFEAPKDVSI